VGNGKENKQWETRRKKTDKVTHVIAWEIMYRMRREKEQSSGVDI